MSRNPSRAAFLAGLGERLVVARLRLGQAQKPARDIGPTEVAEAIGVDPGGYVRWEKGKQDPGLAGVRKAADYLGVPRAWLAWGGDNGLAIPAAPSSAGEAVRKVERLKQGAPSKPRPQFDSG